MGTILIYSCPRCNEEYQPQFEYYGDERVIVPHVCDCGWNEATGPEAVTEPLLPVVLDCPF